jgi:eukaryotic-like serine/threonine-protein kinase
VGPEHPTAAEAHERIGRAYMGLGQWEKSNLELLRALELRRAKPGPRSPDYARSLNALGELAFAQRRFERASALFKEALEVREAAGGSDSPRLAEDLLGLGDCLLALGKPAEALAYLERALPLAEKSENALARGRVRFSLAQALLQSSPEAFPRAVALATEAKAEVAERMKPQVDSWLSAHAGTR